MNVKDYFYLKIIILRLNWVKLDCQLTQVQQSKQDMWGETWKGKNYTCNNINLNTNMTLLVDNYILKHFLNLQVLDVWLSIKLFQNLTLYLESVTIVYLTNHVLCINYEMCKVVTNQVEFPITIPLDSFFCLSVSLMDTPSVLPSVPVTSSSDQSAILSTSSEITPVFIT